MSLIKKKTYTDFETNIFFLFLKTYISKYFLKYQFIPICKTHFVLFDFLLNEK